MKASHPPPSENPQLTAPSTIISLKPDAAIPSSSETGACEGGEGGSLSSTVSVYQKIRKENDDTPGSDGQKRRNAAVIQVQMPTGSNRE